MTGSRELVKSLAKFDTVALRQRVRLGDVEALSHALHETGPLIRSIVRPYCCDENEIDDLAQEVALHALKRYDQVRDDGSIVGWLCSIAKTAGRRFIRSTRRRAAREASYANSLADHGNGIMHHDSDRALEVILLRRYMRTLPDRQRQMLDMRYTQLLSTEEIAKRLGITTSTVRSTISSAILSLRKRLC